MTAETDPTSTDTAPTGTAPTGGSAPAPAAEAAAVAAPEGEGPPAAPAPAAAEPEKRKRGRPKGSTARTTRVVELTLTVSGTADGEWQAELKRGTTWLARALPVSAGAVQKAAAELHAEIAGPIEEVIGEARATREAKVAELEAQLEQAKKALAELD
ncbi:DUF6319 family protein [Pseudonocardia kujensis]|uniref:DUF6319 family protein n=1 Tax=Pseudonocardia kujensis TaxID=1128675 RepID=UPI001E2F2F82|nr:DUF6319 family protein [Pseudonocardia kujensis]MCE0765522.1 DUF6319 family protein [Pseudonocardia kujensis]